MDYKIKKVVLIVLLALIIILLIINITNISLFNNISYFNTLHTNNVYNEAFTIGEKIIINNLQNKLSLSNNTKKAVMFDTDDTLIKYSGEPISEIIHLLNYSKFLGYLVIIITARSDKYYYETINELSKHNITYDKIYLKKDTENFYDFKSNIKESLFKTMNIQIILSVGDNWIDVNGDYSGDFIKLPNKTDSKLYSSVY